MYGGFETVDELSSGGVVSVIAAEIFLDLHDFDIGRGIAADLAHEILLLQQAELDIIGEKYHGGLIAQMRQVELSGDEVLAGDEIDQFFVAELIQVTLDVVLVLEEDDRFGGVLEIRFQFVIEFAVVVLDLRKWDYSG